MTLRTDLRRRIRSPGSFETRLLDAQQYRPARLPAFGGRRQVKRTDLFGRALIGGDKEDALQLVLEDEQSVQAQIVDDHTERQVTAGAFRAERHLAAIPVALDLDGQRDGLARLDRKLRAGPDSWH